MIDRLLLPDGGESALGRSADRYAAQPRHRLHAGERYRDRSRARHDASPIQIARARGCSSSWRCTRRRASAAAMARWGTRRCGSTAISAGRCSTR